MSGMDVNLQVLVKNSALRKTINETIKIILDIENCSEGPLNPELQIFLERLGNTCFIIAQTREHNLSPNPTDPQLLD